MGQRHKRNEMERLLRKRERRGLTYRELSEESGIPIPTLSWWSRKLKAEDGSWATLAESCDLVAVEIVEDEVEGKEAAIEIVLRDELRLVVPPNVSEEHLRCVLRAVASC